MSMGMGENPRQRGAVRRDGCSTLASPKKGQRPVGQRRHGRRCNWRTLLSSELLDGAEPGWDTRQVACRRQIAEEKVNRRIAQGL